MKITKCSINEIKIKLLLLFNKVMVPYPQAAG